MLYTFLPMRKHSSLASHANTQIGWLSRQVFSSQWDDYTNHSTRQNSGLEVNYRYTGKEKHVLELILNQPSFTHLSGDSYPKEIWFSAGRQIAKDWINAARFLETILGCQSQRENRLASLNWCSCSLHQPQVGDLKRSALLHNGNTKTKQFQLKHTWFTSEGSTIPYYRRLCLDSWLAQLPNHNNPNAPGKPG